MKLLLAALLVFGLAGRVAAQHPGSLLQDARQAFLVLEFDRARDLATRSLAARGTDTLTTPDQAGALTLLGIIAVLQDRTAEGRQYFHNAILLDPLYQPDTLTVPSGPLQVFYAAREDTKATTIQIEPTQMVGPDQPLRATVRVSSLHDVVVSVLTADGDTAAVLWNGPIRDTRDVTWSPAAGLANGTYRLVSASVLADTVRREVEVPMTVTAQAPTLVPEPPAPTFLPERGPGSHDVRPLGVGLGLATATLLAPVVAGAETGAPARFVVAGGLAVAGVLGFLRTHRQAMLADNVAANLAARARWERERDRVEAENRARREAPQYRIRTGTPRREERGGS